MLSKFNRGGLIGLMLAAGQCLTAISYAADQPATAASGELEEVIVTGSRIATPNATSTSPIQVVTSQDILVSGKSDISDIINQLPQNFNNDLGQDLGNRTSGLSTAGGVATADLRGLGPNRTLVLVDGRRLGVGSPNTAIQAPGPDLDQIPAALVERVEVVTGGASATYGSDAIAGVVNFIMKKNFQGLQIDGNLSEYWHNNHNAFVQNAMRAVGETPVTGSSMDGRSRNFTITAGANFDDGKGNVTAYFGYLKSDPVASGDRDFGGCQLSSAPTSLLDPPVCLGSSNSNYFRPDSPGSPNAGVPFSVLGSSFIPRGSQPTTPPSLFNSQPYIYMNRGDQRYTAGFSGHVDLKESIRPYVEFNFMNDRSHQQIAPAALFRDSNPNDPTGAGDYYINCSNPLMSAQEQQTLCTPAQIAADQAAIAAGQNPVTVQMRIGRRNVEGGGRYSDYEHTNYRAAFGARGDLGDAWTYDAYGQFYYTTFYNSNNKYLSFANIDKALLVTTDASGNPVCISGGSCVPYNIFKDGGVTNDALNYLYVTGTAYGSTTLRTVHADMTGQLGKYGIKLPTASDGVAVNIGYEARNEHLQFEPDSAEKSGQLSGAGSAAVAINRSISVNEQFIEVRAPLVQDKTGIKDLLFDTGFRRSDYSTSGPVNAYKFEVQYAPTDSVRFRASYQRAIRAPSIIELYNPLNVGLIQLGNDPCAPPASRSLADCLHTVSAAQAAAFTAAYNAGTIPQATLGQLSQLTGGNPNLKPEQADTYTYGLTFKPSMLPNFTGSIDYYNIKLKDTVGVLPANIIMANCLDTGDPGYCNRIVRTPSTFGLVGNSLNSLGYIQQTNVNIGANQVSGVDLQGGYKLALPSGWGSLAFTMNGAYLLKSTTTPTPVSHTFDCAGLFGSTCQTVNPKWHHIVRASWLTPWDMNVSLTWRYIGSVKLDNNDPDPSLHYAVTGWTFLPPGYNAFDARFPSFSYFDLAATWDARKNLQLRAGISNMFDKDPPLASYEIISGGAANTYSTYDQLGRQLFVSFTAKF